MSQKYRREIIALFNRDSHLDLSLQELAQRQNLSLFKFSDPDQFIEFLNYELPEITIYNFKDKTLDVERILSEIRRDPWLHYGGIIGICHREDEMRLFEHLYDTNLLALICEQEYEYYLTRVLKIIRKHRQVLFQRHLQKELLTELSGVFNINNDPFDLSIYANLLTNYLFNAGFIDREGKMALYIALMELLFNAVEHGNCAISFEEKTAWLAQNKDIVDLILLKNRIPAIRAKKVQLRYHITPSYSYFTVTDQGKGFNWKQQLQTKDDPYHPNLELHGRGIDIAHRILKDIKYNVKGNEVSFSFPHLRESPSLPKVFSSHEILYLKKGQIVFKENDESNHLYYIVSGKLAITKKGKRISILTPADVFVGEMSFLLANRRTATVTALAPTVLLCISKREFLAAMRAYPHYTIFLARLLAQRLKRLNLITAKLV